VEERDKEVIVGVRKATLSLAKDSWVALGEVLRAGGKEVRELMPGLGREKEGEEEGKEEAKEEGKEGESEEDV